MTITAFDLRSAAFLSAAAYKNSDDAVAYLAGSSWTPLGSDTAPVPERLP
jgi:hypothetical protein